MAAGCPAKCAKFLLIAFNIIFWLSGAALLAIGIWMLVDDKILDHLHLGSSDGEDEILKYAAYVLIAVGSFVFVTGFAGCCGAIKESACLLGVYIFLLVIVMMSEIAAGVLGFIFRNKIESLVTDKISSAIKNKNYQAEKKDGKIVYTPFGITMNLFQTEFKCCGVNGSSDYPPDLIPFACYELKDTKTKTMKAPQEGDVDPGNLHTTGCGEKMVTWFEKQAIILIGIAIGIACLEIFGIIFAVCLCRNPSPDNYE